MNLTNPFASYKFNSITHESLTCLDQLEYSATKTKRLCLHKDEESELHLMIVDLKAGAKYPFHSHDSSDEIIILMNGSITILFEDDKEVELSTGSQRSLIVEQGRKHAVTCGDKSARYIEVIKGPFKK